MKRMDLVEKIFDVKREKNLTWKGIAEEIGGYSQLYIMTALLGQMRLPKVQAAKAAALFGLTPAEEKMLGEVPYRGEQSLVPPTDPTLYRFHEAIMVFGPTMKEYIHEEFGDGIMSAIDFNMTMEREPNNKGDRVKMNLSGKFLPYKYYGNEEGVPDYGFKEP